MLCYWQSLWFRRGRQVGQVALSVLFIGAIVGMLSACGLQITTTGSATATPVQKVQNIPTVYFGQQDGSVSALQPSNGSVRWHKQLPLLNNQPVSAEALAVFGDVVYVSRLSNTIGTIDAMKVSDGTILWHSTLGTLFVGNTPERLTVVSVVNEVVYVGPNSAATRLMLDAHAGDAYALKESDGSILWHDNFATTGNSQCCRDLIVTPTVIYVGAMDYVDAIKVSDKTLLWHHPLTTVFLGMMMANGNIYLGTTMIDNGGPPKGPVVALQATDGKQVWQSKAYIAPKVFTIMNGVIYISQYGGPLAALREMDGSFLWQFQSSGLIGSLSVTTDVVYATSFNAYSTSVSPEIDGLGVNGGAHLWNYKTNQSGVGDLNAIEVADGMLYLSGSKGVIALDATNRNQRWFSKADNVLALGAVSAS